MLLVERQLRPIATVGNSTNRFRLQIRADGTNQQSVDLPQGKTTIGSSPRCDIRIQQPEVQPLHCLILCEGDRLSARRWAAGTLLNGQPFDEAPLVPGDRLSIGSIEIAVEQPTAATASVESDPHAVAVVGSPAAELAASPAASPSNNSWDEWHSIRKTELRQTDAIDNAAVESVDAAPNTQWPAEWSQQRNDADHSATLTGVHEQLTRLEEKLSSWKDAREDWQRERADLRAENEQTRQHWAAMERQIGGLQSKVSEIAERVERLEQSLPAVHGTPEALSPAIEVTSLRTPVAESGETCDTVDFAPHTTSSLEPSKLDKVEFAEAPPADPEDEFAPFAEFSIWNQGAANASPASDIDLEHRDRIPDLPITEPSDGPVCSKANDPQTAPAKSFIEQYGHMFVEDDADTVPTQEAPRALTASGAVSESEAIAEQPGSVGYAAPKNSLAPPTTVDEEESIEQYMSKLLQRVRGERSSLPGGQSISGGSAIGSSWTSAQTSTAAVGAASQPTVAASELPGAGAKADWLTTSLGTVRRKAPIVEQPADLETLRALANETARRAISKHGLQTHRRYAITKVIVSMLAGMTSLWLMLEAPNWRDLQFITACVSLIAAAYWAGQTFAELIETFRAAAYDGPEDQLEGFVHPSQSGLRTDAAK